MFCRLFTTVLAAAFLIISVAQPFELPGKADRPLANLKLQRDVDVRTSKDHYNNKDHYIYLLTGILRSDGFSQKANKIPCDIVRKLETNGDEAEDFVERIRHGVVPKAIEHLPEKDEIRSAFSVYIGIAYSQPTKTQEVAEASVTGAVDWINELESGFPPPSADPLLWDKFRAIITQGLDTAAHSTTCLRTVCLGSTSTTQSCFLRTTKNAVSPQTIATAVSSKKPTHTTSTEKPILKVTPIMPANSSLAITVIAKISSSTGPVPSIIPEAQTTSLGTRIVPCPSQSMNIGLYVVAVLCVFGVAVFL